MTPRRVPGFASLNPGYNTEPIVTEPPMDVAVSEVRPCDGLQSTIRMPAPGRAA